MKKSIFLLTVFSFLIVVLIGCKEDNFVVDEAEQSLKSASVNAKHVPNEMLVKFKAGVSETQKAAVLEKVNGKVSEKILTKLMENTGDKEGILLVSIPIQAMEAISRVNDLPEVEYAEPNFIYEHTATSNDPYYTNGSLWGMYGDATFSMEISLIWCTGRMGK